MARILKSGVQRRIEDAASRIAQYLFGSLDPSEQNVIVGTVTRTPFEQLAKVVGTHASDGGKLRQA